MQTLHTNFENCYGIKKLIHDFDFSNSKTIITYAPNGVMKTSFAKTFRDISNGDQPTDRVYPENNSVFEIIDDSTNSQILPEEIFVVEPYTEKVFDSENKILTLLAKEELRKRYQEIYSDLESNQKAFITKLKKVSGSSDCQDEVGSTFSDLGVSNFFEILKVISPHIESQQETYNFKYNDVFPKNGKVKAFIELHHDLLLDYAEKYEKVISESSFFRGAGEKSFGTAQARTIINAIQDDSFFEAGHKLEIENTGHIESTEELTNLVNKEISRIVDTPEVKEVFVKIDTALQKNKDLEKFKKVIEKDNTLVSKLLDYESFKKEVWYAYLNNKKEDILSLIELYDERKTQLELISEEARESLTIWDKAVDEFNDRFINLPFKLIIRNKKDAILSNETPSIDFLFDNRPIQRKDLLDVLSQGERRAFYLLNIIFEVKSRELNEQKTVFIIDDIADSFDYKNKYAIVEYLNDISKNDNFYQIILTHNFDFYRILSSRLIGRHRQNKLHAFRTNTETKIITEVYQNPPFKTWKSCMKAGTYYGRNYTTEDAKKHILALIPLVRNLIEYGTDRNVCTYALDQDYLLLTHLLHIKNETFNITFGSLQEIYEEYLGVSDFDVALDLNERVYNALVLIADNIQPNEFNLENKIILAIVIRLKAEEFMWGRVTDQTRIGGSTTGKLFGRYKDEFENVPGEEEIINVLESVNIMTPENIHINSFMYEPILDMGIEELINLYARLNEM